MSPGRTPDVFHARVLLPTRVGLWTFRVDGWGDPITTWRRAVTAKLDAGQSEAELSNDLLVGARAVGTGRRSACRASCATRCSRPPTRLRAPGDPLTRAGAALAPTRSPNCSAQYPLRELLTRGETVRRLGGPAAGPIRRLVRDVPAVHRRLGQPTASRCTARSRPPPRRCPAIAAMGFDVVYLPPIHPIGKVHRKGRNNSVTAAPGDVGSPWAIGSDEGGHDAVHPELGTDRRTSTTSSPRPATKGSRWRWIWRCSARPTIRGPRSTPNGSPCCPTAPSPTRRTRRRSTRTSTRSTSTTIPTGSTTRCCGWSGTGSTTASRSFASTTRTPSRPTSGRG